LGIFHCYIFVASNHAAALSCTRAVSGGSRCAKTLFEKMLASVLRAPVSYFETVPLGRILNRFTYDVEFVDVTLTESMSILMTSIGWFVAGVCIMCIILPWIALALLPVTLLYGFLMLHYRKSGADLQRIDATTRSPIQAMLAEGERIGNSPVLSNGSFYCCSYH
jgi:ABC-type multidrug transport system fused ATPase/permease subunit